MQQANGCLRICHMPNIAFLRFKNDLAGAGRLFKVMANVEKKKFMKLYEAPRKSTGAQEYPHRLGQLLRLTELMIVSDVRM